MDRTSMCLKLNLLLLLHQLIIKLHVNNLLLLKIISTMEKIWLQLYFAARNVVCSWGRGEDGQLGHGDAEDRFSPTQVSALDGQEIVSVSCGADHTTAYSESSKQVFSWGWYVISTQ